LSLEELEPRKEFFEELFLIWKASIPSFSLISASKYCDCKLS